MSIPVPESDRAGVRDRGTPWRIWKAVYLNRLFDDWHSGQKNATVGSGSNSRQALCGTEPFEAALVCDKLPWKELDDFQRYRQRDPLPLPERAVTIGIGVLCTDGIVIATDTQYTRGGFKSHGPKLFDLFPMKRGNVSIVACGAGTVSSMKMAIRKLEDRLEDISDPSLEQVKGLIEEVLLDFYRKHVYPVPDHMQTPDFELLLGVWTKKDNRFDLLRTDSTTVTEVVTYGTGHCCIGTGIPLSEYALSLMYQTGISTENATFLASFCIKAAKDYVGSCGGRTNIHILRHNGTIHSVPSFEVTDAETYSDDLFDIIRAVLDCLDPEALPDDTTIGTVTDHLKNSIIEFRNKQKARRERLRKLRRKPIESAPFTPRAQ